MRRFLPGPDGTKPFPGWRSGPPVPLWLESRILAIEATEEFKAAHAAAAARKASAAKAVETKMAAMDRWVDSLEVELPDIDGATLMRLACEHYNGRQMDLYLDGRIDHVRTATPESDPGFLRRISVNWLGHRATEYEPLLDSTFGRVGTDRAYGRIRAKVLDAIAARYPGLEAECERQKGSGG